MLLTNIVVASILTGALGSPELRSQAEAQDALFDQSAFRTAVTRTYGSTPKKSLVEDENQLFRFQAAVESALMAQLGEVRATFLKVPNPDDPTKLSAYLLTVEARPIQVVGDFEENLESIAKYEGNVMLVSRSLYPIRRAFRALFESDGKQFDIQVTAGQNRATSYRVLNTELQVTRGNLGLYAGVGAPPEPSAPPFVAVRTLAPALLKLGYKLPTKFEKADPAQIWIKVLSDSKRLGHSVKSSEKGYEATCKTTVMGSGNSPSVFVIYRLGLYKDSQLRWNLGIDLEAREDVSNHELTNSSYEEEMLDFFMGGLNKQ